METRVMWHRLCVLAFLAILCVAPHATAADVKRPNLLIVMTDEHNFRTLGCYRRLLPKDQALMWGKAVVETPHIDWLAEKGAICTSFYAATPVCSPSRAAFVSGRYPQNTPVTTNNIPLADDIVTFAEVLRRDGYATGYAGKWHIDGAGKPQWAPKRQFGFTDNRYMFNRGHWKQLEDTPEGPRVAARSGKAPSYSIAGANRRNFTTDFLADKAVEFIKEHREEPFCYMLSLPDPHGPDTVRPPYDTMYADQTYRQPRSAGKPDEGLPSWGKKQQGGYDQSKYYGMVKCIDDNMGKILGAVWRAGVLEHTIVVFTADHGDLRGEHHRHNKGVPYEGSARVPFVVYFPEKIQAGTVVPQALTTADFQPTILNLMGAKTSGKEEGRDASGLFTGKADDWADFAFMRSTGKPGDSTGWLAVVSDRYKLVFSSRDEPWLFDLEKDAHEMTNAFGRPEQRETVREFSKALAAYAKQTADPYVTSPRIKHDLDWAVHGTGPYEAPPESSP